MSFAPFSKKQLEALCWWHKQSPYARCDAIVCDGAVRSGKTVCMSLSFVVWAFYRFGEGDFALCGKTIRSLVRNVVTPLVPRLLELGFSCTLKKSENLLLLRLQEKQMRFYLFGGRDESSPALIQGVTLSGVLFDEVALMPRSFVEQALARCSVEGSTFWFNCNPEGPGHWFYQEWICKAKEKNLFYLHFTMDDNPSLSANMKKRYQNLYTGVFYERFIEGKWVAAEGLVYPFMAQRSAFAAAPKATPRRFFVSCDYGTKNPSSFGLWGEVDGVWYRLGEYYYDARKQGAPRTDEEHYKGLQELAGGRRIEAVVVDPSAASFIETIRRHGEFRVLAARNDVLNGIREVSVALKEGRIKICESCLDSMREFSLYRWEDQRAMDTPKKEHDHAMDDIRYFVSTCLRQEEGGFYALAAGRQRAF